MPLVPVPLPGGVGLLGRGGGLALISLLIRVSLTGRIGQRVLGRSRRRGLLSMPTLRARRHRPARLHLRVGLHLRARLFPLTRVEHNRRRLLTCVGRPCLLARRPLIGRVGRPLLLR